MNFTTDKSVSSPFDSSTDITVFNVTGIFALTGFLIILFINYLFILIYILLFHLLIVSFSKVAVANGVKRFLSAKS